MEDDDEQRRKKRLKTLIEQTQIVHNQISGFMAVAQSLIQLAESSSDDDDDDGGGGKPVNNFRSKPRPGRHHFDHACADAAIWRDFLGPQPSCKEFSHIYRVSKTRFQRMLEDFGNSDIKFYHPKYGASLEVRLLLPLKCLAFAEGAHQSTSYFQVSRTFSRECSFQFDEAFKVLYLAEYLRIPDASDLREISLMHEKKHGVPGMFGSLDCWHTEWKNCPKAWQGSYKNGKEKKPTIKMEAVCDHHLWFWHASYGYAGTMNDINVMDRSPLLARFADGRFAVVENEAGTVPYSIGEEEFPQMFVLTDGAYPQFSRFVKGIKVPLTAEQKKYTGWQEAARKDIERAFGVIQILWKFTARPILLYGLQNISARIATCMMLHNMLVSDRVMDGDVYARYRPSNSNEDNYDLLDEASILAQLGDENNYTEDWDSDEEDDLDSCDVISEESDTSDNQGDMTAAINANSDGLQTRLPNLWSDLANKEEHARLLKALMDFWKSNTPRS